MKKKITKRLEDVLYLLDGRTLQEAIVLFEDRINKYKDYDRLELNEDTECEGGRECKVLEIIGVREETDAEYKNRIVAETNKKNAEEARQRAEYEKLKKKFEKRD